MSSDLKLSFDDDFLKSFLDKLDNQYNESDVSDPGVHHDDYLDYGGHFYDDDDDGNPFMGPDSLGDYPLYDDHLADGGGGVGAGGAMGGGGGHLGDVLLYNVSTEGNRTAPDLQEVDDLLNKFKILYEKPVSPWLFWTLVTVYSVFIIVGLFGNLLIVWAVLGRENMRTARNVFIVTLAISDLVLCTFTMPSTLWEVLYRRWPFGPETQWLCQLANAGQATPVFMSSLSIVAIAVDRYRCIIQPDLKQLTVRASVFVSVAMVTLSSVMSIPLFIGTELVKLIEVGNMFPSLDDTLVCIDDRSGAYRTTYNLIATFVQFILPLLIVFCVYLSIFCRLRDRPQSQHSENNRRRRRTNIMIILISISFFLSWLPLNVVNILLDFSPDFMSSHLNGQDALVYGICNILGLSNACINPVLYGYFNENFRKEYKSIYRAIPWRRLSVRRNNGRCRFELVAVVDDNNGGGRRDADGCNGGVGATDDTNSQLYNNSVSLGNYRHSSQEFSTTMSAPAALVNSTGVLVQQQQQQQQPKRMLMASCKNCRKQLAGKRRGGPGGIWLGFLAKWKRAAFFRKICDVEEKEGEDERGGGVPRCTHGGNGATTLRWAPVRKVRYMNGVDSSTSSSSRPPAPPGGHAREKEWERRKRQRRLERAKAASLSSLAHPRNYRRGAHLAQRGNNRRFVQVRFTEEDEAKVKRDARRNRRRFLSLSQDGAAAGTTGSSHSSVEVNAASLVKVRFGNIPKYSVQSVADEGRSDERKAGNGVPPGIKKKSLDDDVKQENGASSLPEEEEEELLVVTRQQKDE